MWWSDPAKEVLNIVRALIRMHIIRNTYSWTIEGVQSRPGTLC